MVDGIGEKFKDCVHYAEGTLRILEREARVCVKAFPDSFEMGDCEKQAKGLRPGVSHFHRTVYLCEFNRRSK